VQFILLLFRVINIERRNFALASSKYPNLEGLVKLQSLKRLRGRFRFYENFGPGKKTSPPGFRCQTFGGKIIHQLL
jgi:hypothetical protein